MLRALWHAAQPAPAHFFTSQLPNRGPSPQTATCSPHCSAGWAMGLQHWAGYGQGATCKLLIPARTSRAVGPNWPASSTRYGSAAGATHAALPALA